MSVPPGHVPQERSGCCGKVHNGAPCFHRRIQMVKPIETAAQLAQGIRVYLSGTPDQQRAALSRNTHYFVFMRDPTCNAWLTAPSKFCVNGLSHDEYATTSIDDRIKGGEAWKITLGLADTEFKWGQLPAEVQAAWRLWHSRIPSSPVKLERGRFAELKP